MTSPPAKAAAVQVVRVLLRQAGQEVPEEALLGAWAALAAAGAEPSTLELLARLRADGALAGSLLACERPPELASTVFEFGAAPGAPTVTVAPPAPPRAPAPAPAPTPAPALGPGSGWSYELAELIGEGGMGAVYLAWDRALLRQAAVKRLRAAAASADERDRFLLEAQVLSQLDHPNVLPVYALASDPDGAVSCALKLVRGRTLAAVLEEHRARGPGRAAAALPERLELFVKVCEGVHYAHDRGVLHRDLKPGNVMVGAHGEVYVIDWGLCKVVARAEDPAFAAGPPAEPAFGAPRAAPGDDLSVGVVLERTQVGILKGTPLYFAPEQARGDPAAIGPATDQFALGLILHELVALEPAYRGRTLPELLLEAGDARRRPVPPGRGASPDLLAVVDRATALDPAARYPSVRDLADDVRRVLRGEETRARPDDPFRKLRRWVARHAGGVLVAGLLGLVLLAAGGLGLELRRRLAAAEAAAAAQAREDEEQEALLTLRGRAARVAQHFAWYEAELEGLAGAAEHALVAGVAADEPRYARERLADPAAAPPDLAPSPLYRAPISPAWPLCEAAAGADPAQVEDEARRLLTIRPRLLDVFRGRPTPDGPAAGAAPRARPLRPGEAVEWAYVVLESTGLIVLLPGSAGVGWEPGFDIRTVPTYRAAKADALAGRLRSWSAPYEDLLGQGRLVTRNRALLDPAGRLLGVASLDLSLDEVARVDLALEPGVRWAGLLDERGRVVVASDGAAAGAGAPAPGGELTLAPYGRPEVVTRIAAGAAQGLVRVGANESAIVAWQRLDPLPWTLALELER